MTEFRTKGKGKDRIVYPINERKAYGENKTLAKNTVEKLRTMGIRSRLIETNRKHKLYAPYVSALEPDNLEKVISIETQAQPKTPEQTSEEHKPAQENGRTLTESEMSDLIKKLEWLNQIGVSKGQPVFVRDFKDETIADALHGKSEDDENKIAVDYDPHTDETTFGILSSDGTYMFYVAMKGKINFNSHSKYHILSTTVPIKSKVDAASFYDFMSAINKFNREKKGDEITFIHVSKPAGEDTITIRPEISTEFNPEAAKIPTLKLKASSEIDVPVDDGFSVERINKFLRKIKPLVKEGELDFNILRPGYKDSPTRLLNIEAKVGNDRYGYVAAPEAK